MPKFNLKPIVETGVPIVVAFAALFGLMFMLIERIDNRLDAMESRLNDRITDVETRLSADILMTREEVAETRKDIKELSDRIQEVERSQSRLDGAFDILNQQLSDGLPGPNP